MMKYYLFLPVMLFLLVNNAGAVNSVDVIQRESSDIEYEIEVGKQVMITADLTNGQDRNQKFAYLVQIKNQDNIVVSLSWLTGSLSPRQSFTPAQSWTTDTSGVYYVEIFVWESVDNPEALSPPLSMTITVD